MKPTVMNALSQLMNDHIDKYSPEFEGKTCHDYMRKKLNNEFSSSNSTLGWNENWKRELSNQAYYDFVYSQNFSSSLLNALGSGCNEKTVSKCEALSPPNNLTDPEGW